jgi:hypothetical protein
VNTLMIISKDQGPRFKEAGAVSATVFAKRLVNAAVAFFPSLLTSSSAADTGITRGDKAGAVKPFDYEQLNAL